MVTGLLEFAAAGYTFLSSGRKRILYPVGLLFLLLAAYQFSEVAVCAHPENLLFARIAFFDITWLPPLGLWLTYQLGFSDKKSFKTLPLAYFAAALGLVMWIFLDPNCVTKSVCQLVIARYVHLSPFDLVYGIFYQSGLVVFIFWAAAGMVRTVDPVLKKNLANVQMGVLGFVLPSLYVRILYPEPDGILPSVMCHFALILAFFLFILVIRERRTLRSQTKLVNE